MTGFATSAALALILLSAVISASETAIFTIGESRLRTLREEGFRGAGALAGLRSRPDLFHVLFLIFNTLTTSWRAAFWFISPRSNGAPEERASCSRSPRPRSSSRESCFRG